MKSGFDRIKDERARQLAVEKWTSENDDQMGQGQIARAADCYDRHARHWCNQGVPAEGVPEDWPWAAEWWKPQPSPERCWEKAGALYLAEATRLRRGGLWIPADQRTTQAMECAAAIDRCVRALAQEVVGEVLWEFAEAQRKGPHDSFLLEKGPDGEEIQIPLNTHAWSKRVEEIMAAFGYDMEPID